MKRLLAVSVLILALAVLAGNRPASAQTCYVGCNPPVQIAAQTGTAPAVSGATVSPVVPAAAPQASTQLAFTGADIAGMVTIGLLLIVGGAGVLAGTRRRAHGRPTR